MKILICGSDESGKTSFAEILIYYVLNNFDYYKDEDLATAIDVKSDLNTVIRLATLIDERERIYKQAKKDRLVVGSKGQVVLNPLYSALLKIDAEIRQLEDRLGMNPKSRISLGIQLGQMKKTLADLNADLEEE